MRRRIAVFLLLTCMIGGCRNIKVENPTNDFREPKRLAKLENPILAEISGIVASERNPGLFWVHNDSGNKPEVYLINQELEIVLTCSLESVKNRDWEDIAIGPGPVKGKTYLYVGDIGDNNSNYTLKYIYRFEEPRLGEKTDRIAISDFETITFRLSDKRKDTETLLIDPVSKDLFVVTKRETPVWVYRLPFPQSTSDTLVAERLFSLPMTQIVGGDISSDGKKILLKNYEHVYYWTGDKYIPVAERLQEEFYEVPYEVEPQGEAIAWDRKGRSFYTISEKNLGKNTYLYRYQRRKN